nr:EOG090X0FIE [Polyphemus pediculus]
MAVLISLVSRNSNMLLPIPKNSNQLVKQMSDHPVMKIAPSRWSWNRFKEMLNFYTMLGVIPSVLLITYVNLTSSPAKLIETPEDYVPQHWEYYSHPITRFLAKHTTKSYQQEYEMMLHFLYEEDYKRKLRLAEKRIKEKMAEKQDYQAYYYQPVTARYQRYVRDKNEESVVRGGN